MPNCVTRARPSPGLRLDLAGAGRDAGRRGVCRRGRAGSLGCARRAHRTAAAGRQACGRPNPPPPNWPSSAARCRPKVDEVQRLALADDAAGQRLLNRLDAAQPGGGQHSGHRSRRDGNRDRPGREPESLRRVQAAGERQPADHPRPRPAARRQFAVGQWRRGHLGRRRPDRAQRDHPSGRGSHPGRQQPHQQPVHHPGHRAAARDAGRLRPTARDYAGFGCWRFPTASA